MYLQYIYGLIYIGIKYKRQIWLWFRYFKTYTVKGFIKFVPQIFDNLKNCKIVQKNYRYTFFTFQTISFLRQKFVGHIYEIFLTVYFERLLNPSSPLQVPFQLKLNSL